MGPLRPIYSRFVPKLDLLIYLFKNKRIKDLFRYKNKMVGHNLAINLLIFYARLNFNQYA